MIFVYIRKIFNKYLELKTVEVLSGDSLVISALMVTFLGHGLDVSHLISHRAHRVHRE